MPICIHCRLPLATLYTTYSRADDRSLGKGVRLTQCPRCKNFADKYVEHDFVVLFIDLVLIKPQVYRHLLFNRLGGACGDYARKSSAPRTRRYGDWDPVIIRLGILLLLFDVYLTWARIEKMSSMSTEVPALSLPPASSTAINTTDALTSLTTSPVSAAGNYFLANQSILNQYLFFLLLCALETVTFHGIVRLLSTSGWLSRPQRRGTTRSEQAYREHTRSVRDSATTSARSSGPTSRIHSARPSTEELLTPPTTFSAPPSPIIPSSIPATAASAASISLPTTAPTSTSTSLPRSSTPLPTSGHSSTPSQSTAPVPQAPPQPTATTISTALLVSSLPNLFPILMVIWQYDLPSSASAVSWAVIVNNIAALEILLDCGVIKAAAVVCAAAVGRWAVGETMLEFVGLGEGVVGSLARMGSGNGGLGMWSLFGS